MMILMVIICLGNTSVKFSKNDGNLKMSMVSWLGLEVIQEVWNFLRYTHMKLLEKLLLLARPENFHKTSCLRFPFGSSNNV